MKFKKILWMVALLVLMGTLTSGQADAQKQDPRWSGPFQLSNPDRQVIGYLDAAVVASDSYGFVHALWLEGGVPNNRYVIQYARFDGTNWSSPVDIYLSEPGDSYGFLSNPVITHDGILHLLFTRSQFGTVLHMSAPASQTLSAQNWTTYPLLPEPYYRVSLAESADGALHLVGASMYGVKKGVYYQSSIDGGRTWSAQKWLNPDIPPNAGATTAAIRIDPDTEILHVAFRRDDFQPDGTVRWQGVYYTRSQDGGQTWAPVVALATAEEDQEEHQVDRLVLNASGGQVHILWPGVVATHRHHAYSTDSGESWIGPLRVFGNLLGAAGDDLVVDGSGDFHFLAQLRYPQGLYETVWDGARWDIPTLVYLIAESAVSSIGDRIHIHNISATVRHGNELIVIFTDPPADPERGVYTMRCELAGISPAEIEPTPRPTEIPTLPPPSEPALDDNETSIPTTVALNKQPPSSPHTPGGSLAVSIAAVLVLLGAVMVIRRRNGNRR